MTGDPRTAERLTARALRETFAALAEFDGATSLGRWVLTRLEATLRELPGEAAPPAGTHAEQRNEA